MITTYLFENQMQECIYFYRVEKAENQYDCQPITEIEIDSLEHTPRENGSARAVATNKMVYFCF